MAPRSLLDVDDLSPEELVGVLDRAVAFRDVLPSRDLLAGVPVLNLFFEASTRTATSFSLAEQRVGADIISFAPGASSLGKGETIADTALTLSGIGVRVIVVRHQESGFARRLADTFDGHVINAGDGTHAHPTQALLDLMTLRQEFGRFDGLRGAIVGDILHSRVARSNIVGMRALGIEVTLVGPATLLPEAFAAEGVRVERLLHAARTVRIALRGQSRGRRFNPLDRGDDKSRRLRGRWRRLRVLSAIQLGPHASPRIP